MFSRPCIHAPRLNEVKFVNFWVLLASHELSKLSISFTAAASLRPHFDIITNDLYDGGGAASLRSLSLAGISHASQTFPSLVEVNTLFPALQELLVEDSPTATVDLVSKFMWESEIKLIVRTTLTSSSASEMVQLAGIFGMLEP